MKKPTLAPPILITNADGKPVLMAECSRSWGSLARPSDPEVRHCGSCDHLVHRSDSDASLVEHARRGHCVHIPVAVENSRGGKTGGVYVGDLSARGADTAWLVVLDGPHARTTIVLRDQSVTIGRGPADVVIDDPTLAPEHLRIVREDDALRLYELHRPGAPVRDLLDGDVVELGEARAMLKTVRDFDRQAPDTSRQRVGSPYPPPKTWPEIPPLHPRKAPARPRPMVGVFFAVDRCVPLPELASAARALLSILDSRPREFVMLVENDAAAVDVRWFTFLASPGRDYARQPWIESLYSSMEWKVAVACVDEADEVARLELEGPLESLGPETLSVPMGRLRTLRNGGDVYVVRGSDDLEDLVPRCSTHPDD